MEMQVNEMYIAGICRKAFAIKVATLLAWQ